MGLFVGIFERNDNLLVFTAEGVVQARSVRRLPADERAAPDLLGAVVGTPWCFKPGEGDMAVPIVVHADPVVLPADLPNLPPPPPVARRNVTRGRAEAARRHRGLPRVRLSSHRRLLARTH